MYRSNNQETEEEFMKEIYQMEFYLLDNHSLNDDKMAHKKKIKENERNDESTIAKFSPIENSVYLSISFHEAKMLFRNYKEHVNLKTISLIDLPTCFEISNVDDIIAIGTKTGKILFYNYFSGLMIDYEILHNCSVKKLCLEIAKKDNSRQDKDDVVYAFDYDDPRNKSRYLRRVYSMCNESVVVSRYLKNEL